MFDRHLDHGVDALDSLVGFGTVAMPRQPFGRRNFVLYGASVRRQQIGKFPRRMLDGTKFHGDVKPIQNPIQRPPGSIDGFLKFACTSETIVIF